MHVESVELGDVRRFFTFAVLAIVWRALERFEFAVGVFYKWSW